MQIEVRMVKGSESRTDGRERKRQQPPTPVQPTPGAAAAKPADKAAKSDQPCAEQLTTEAIVPVVPVPQLPAIGQQQKESSGQEVAKDLHLSLSQDHLFEVTMMEQEDDDSLAIAGEPEVPAGAEDETAAKHPIADGAHVRDNVASGTQLTILYLLTPDTPGTPPPPLSFCWWLIGEGP